jgi:hypothetical protein
MVVQAYRCSDEAVPCRENSNVDVVVRSMLRAPVAPPRRLAALVAAFPLFLPFFPLLLFLVVARSGGHKGGGGVDGGGLGHPGWRLLIGDGDHGKASGGEGVWGHVEAINAIVLGFWGSQLVMIGLASPIFGITGWLWKGRRCPAAVGVTATSRMSRRRWEDGARWPTCVACIRESMLNRSSMDGW